MAVGIVKSVMSDGRVTVAMQDLSLSHAGGAGPMQASFTAMQAGKLCIGKLLRIKPVNLKLTCRGCLSVDDGLTKCGGCHVVKSCSGPCHNIILLLLQQAKLGQQLPVH